MRTCEAQVDGRGVVVTVQAAHRGGPQAYVCHEAKQEHEAERELKRSLAGPPSNRLSLREVHNDTAAEADIPYLAIVVVV